MTHVERCTHDSDVPQRVFGTLAGAVLVGLLVDVGHPDHPVTALLTVLLSIRMFAVLCAAYWLYAAQLAAVVVLLLDLVPPDSDITALDRALYTTTGGVLVVGTRVVFQRHRPIEQKTAAHWRVADHRNPKEPKHDETHGRAG